MVVGGRAEVIGSAWRWAIFHTPSSYRNTRVARSTVTTVYRCGRRPCPHAARSGAHSRAPTWRTWRFPGSCWTPPRSAADRPLGSSTPPSGPPPRPWRAPDGVQRISERDVVTVGEEAHHRFRVTFDIIPQCFARKPAMTSFRSCSVIRSPHDSSGTRSFPQAAGRSGGLRSAWRCTARHCPLSRRYTCVARSSVGAGGAPSAEAVYRSTATVYAKFPSTPRPTSPTQSCAHWRTWRPQPERLRHPLRSGIDKPACGEKRHWVGCRPRARFGSASPS